MERSQLPLLRKKKGSKDTAAKEKRELPLKEKSSEGKVSPFKNNSSATGLKNNHLRESSPNDDRTLKREPRPVTDVDCENVVAKDCPRKATTPVDLEWSKYMVKGGSPSDNYQKFNPEKSPGAGKNSQKYGSIPQKSHLPHQVGLSTKFTSVDGYSPSAVQKELRIYGGSPGHSTAPSVFTFDPKHLYDPDSSPIYHELDPIEGGNNHLPVNHTYQSITEIREEVERLLQTGNGPSPAGQSHSGTSKSPVRSSSGPVLLCSSGQNGCSSPRRRGNQSNATTLPLPKPSAPPKSPAASPAHSPIVAPPPITSTTSRAQSIFSKLWLQKKNALAKAAAAANTGPASTALAGPTAARNRSLDAISVEVPKVPKKHNKTYSTLYAVTSPPPITASVFANYYQNFDPGQNNDEDDPMVRRPALDHFDYYGLPSERNLRGFCGHSKRSFSDSTTAGHAPVPKSKTSHHQSGVENRLPWRTYRDLSPGRSCVDRWDVVRFGEPLESHISGGGVVSLETFKGGGSCSSKSSLKQTKAPPSPARHQTGKGPLIQGVMTSSPMKKEFSPGKSKASRICGRTIRPNDEAKDTERLDKTKPKNRLYKTQLSKSQENVLSNFSLEFLQSPPGSFESLLSEDDVFLPGSSERLNLLSPPSSRTTFSSPSCGIRMAELRAGRRRSDSKSPSPEPPAASSTTPPPFLPLFQIPPPCRRGVEAGVVKQDAAVQTSPTESPVRIGGLSPHRYMHTIIEEDHPDQGSSTDGKTTIAEHTSRVVLAAVPKGKSTLSAREIDEKIRSSGATDTGERCHAGNLLSAISTDDDDDDDDDDDNGSSGEIKLSHTSSNSAGNDRLGPEEPRTEDDALPSASTPLPKTISCTEGPLKKSPPSDRRTPEGECSPRSVGETGSAAVSTSTSSPRSKTSRLRPPKPAKFFAAARAAANHQCADETSVSRYSPVGLLLPRAKVGEIHPPLKQFSDVLPPSTTTTTTTTTTTKTQSIKHAASARSAVELSVGTGDHAAGKPSVEGEPQGPVKGCRNGSAAAHQQGGSRTVGQREEKRNISQLKSLFDPPAATESQDRTADAMGGTRRGRTGAQRRQLSAEHSDSSPVSCSRHTAGNFPSKWDSNATTTTTTTTTTAKHSSLSSSLTSSSSSSVFSVPDSESEGTTLVRPSRKDSSACAGRPGNNGKLLSDGSVTVKTIVGDGNSQEKSRLALPRISVSRSKDKFVTGTPSQHEGSVKQESMFTNDNTCDDDNDDDDDDETMKLSSSELIST